jgi:hypothetical protein
VVRVLPRGKNKGYSEELILKGFIMTKSKAIAMAQDVIESAESKNRTNQKLLNESSLNDPHYIATLKEDIRMNDRLCTRMRVFINQMGKPNIFDKALYTITKN